MSDATSTDSTETTDSTDSTGAAEPGGSAPDAGAPSARRARKVREGLVVSDVMTKTVVVEVIDRVRHRRYGKTMQVTSRLKVHDEDETARVGDRVRVMETRPLSKTKRWRLTEVVERAR